MPRSLPALLSAVRGVVLDVGPGSGEQLHLFSRPENIEAVYGVEPGVDLHGKLMANAVKVGLGGKYHVLGATADLESMLPAMIKDGLIKEERTSADELQLFDDVVCVRVLCGVPDQAATAADLYALLKPGGRLFLCEHVLNERNGVARLAQWVYMKMGWSYLMGGCELMRNTVETLSRVAAEKDGGWESVDVHEVDGYGPLVHIVGVLVKKK